MSKLSTIQFKALFFMQRMLEEVTRDKKVLLVFALVVGEGAHNEASAQLDQVRQRFTENFGQFYGILTVFIAAVAIYFGGKTIGEIIRGEQGAWVKLGGIVLGFVLWLAVPPAIKFMTSQASSINNSNF